MGWWELSERKYLLAKRKKEEGREIEEYKTRREEWGFYSVAGKKRQ